MSQRSTASTASQAFACDAFSLNASTVVMSAVASRRRAKFVATDALLARRASSLPAASQVFIAACKAVEASSRAWAMVGRRVRSTTSQASCYSGGAWRSARPVLSLDINKI